MQNAWGKFWRTWCTFWSTCGRKFLYLARKYLNIIVFSSNQFAIKAFKNHQIFQNFGLFFTRAVVIWPWILFHTIPQISWKSYFYGNINMFIFTWTFSNDIYKSLNVFFTIVGMVMFGILTRLTTPPNCCSLCDMLNQNFLGSHFVVLLFHKIFYWYCSSVSCGSESDSDWSSLIFSMNMQNTSEHFNVVINSKAVHISVNNEENDIST